MSRIRPEELPTPKKVSKRRAGELLSKFSVSGTSKYDIYVNAALDLNPGESLDVIVLPENVITSIQKKFREQGLTRSKGYFVMSKALGNEKAGFKSLLIGRYASIPKATSTTRKKSSTGSKATRASKAKVAQKRSTTAKSKSTTPKTKSTSKRTTKSTRSKRAITAKTKAQRTNGVAVTA